MRKWVCILGAVFGLVVFVVLFGDMIYQALALGFFPPATPLSTAIVAAIYESPRGLTDVSEQLCALVTPEALKETEGQLWALNAAVGAAFGEPSGTLIATFSKANNVLEGAQRLRILVYPDQACQAYIQSYSW
jgi:hypothetical protein